MTRLVRLPLTLVRLPAEVGLAVAKRVAGGTVDAARLVYDAVAGGQEIATGDEVRRTPAAGRRERFEEAAAPTADAAAVDGEPVPPAAEPRPAAAEPEAPAPPAEEPAHVSEEPTLVAELAEQGAEEGAGAEVRLDAPWPGYDRMTAAAIRERLAAEPAEAAAAVSLYEAAGKGRRSVLDAAARGLRR